RIEDGALPVQPPAADVPPTASNTIEPAVRDTPPTINGDPGSPPKMGDEGGPYERAFEALRSGDYAESARRFQQFLVDFPAGSYAPNARYWLGESHYLTQDYRLALEQFQSLIQLHPTHDKAPGALLKVGLAHYGLNDLDAAEET